MPIFALRESMMNALRKVQTLFALGLLGAVGMIALPAAAEPPDNETPYQPYLPPGSLRCTMSGGTETGREWGAIYMTNKPGVCRRVRLGGPAPADFPSCYQRGREELGCSLIVD